MRTYNWIPSKSLFLNLEWEPMWVLIENLFQNPKLELFWMSNKNLFCISSENWFLNRKWEPFLNLEWETLESWVRIYFWIPKENHFWIPKGDIFESWVRTFLAEPFEYKLPKLHSQLKFKPYFEFFFSCLTLGCMYTFKYKVTF